MIKNPIIAGRGIKLPELTIPGTAADLLAPKQLIDADGNVLTGTMPTKNAADLTVSGAAVTVPAGYYASDVSESVATVDQATPAITVSSAGLITASAAQTAGYVAEGTKSATKQLTTKAAATITPGAANQTIAAGTYLTGAQTIKGDANLLAANIKSGVSIFGVAGALVSGMQSYQITETYADSSGPFTFTCGFEPKAALIFNNDVKSTTSGSAETFQDFVVFIYPELNIYLTVYLKLSTQTVWCQTTTQTAFEKNYTWSFTSTGMTLLKNAGDVFDGTYTILLFA